MFSDGSSFIGEMRHNQLSEGTYSCESGVYEGSFKDNRFHGKGKLTFKEKRIETSVKEEEKKEEEQEIQ